MKNTSEIINVGRQYEAKGDLDQAYEAYFTAAESVEITWINNDSAQVIFRYTIGGFNQGDKCLSEISDFNLMM